MSLCSVATLREYPKKEHSGLCCLMAAAELCVLHNKTTGSNNRTHIIVRSMFAPSYTYKSAKISATSLANYVGYLHKGESKFVALGLWDDASSICSRGDRGGRQLAHVHYYVLTLALSPPLSSLSHFKPQIVSLTTIEKQPTCLPLLRPEIAPNALSRLVNNCCCVLIALETKNQ